MCRTRRLAALAMLIPVVALAEAALPPPPDTPKKPVTDEYHGTNVTEDYRWLEDSAAPAVKRWSDAQNVRTRAYLDGLPGYGAVRARVDELIRSSSIAYGVQGRARCSRITSTRHRSMDGDDSSHPVRALCPPARA